MAIELQKHSKGARPHFFADPSVDKLVAMLLALAGEVSVLHDRLDTVERLLDNEGNRLRERIESYRPSSEVIKARDEWRANYLKQILRILDVEVTGDAGNDISKEWQAVIDGMTA